MVALATLVFLWGIIQYVIAQGDEKKLQESRQYMIYGIIGLAVMISVWGIVNIVIITIFGAGSTEDPFLFPVPNQVEDSAH